MEALFNVIVLVLPLVLLGGMIGETLSKRKGLHNASNKSNWTTESTVSSSNKTLRKDKGIFQ